MEAAEFLRLTDNAEADGFTPFSNATEALMWGDGNCDICRRSLACRNGIAFQGMDDAGFRAGVLSGRECGAKYALDFGWITGKIAPAVSLWMGGTADRLPDTCQHLNTDPDFDPEKNPQTIDPNQLNLFPGMYPERLLQAREATFASLQN